MPEPLGHVEIENRNGMRIARIHGEVDVSNVEDIEKEIEGPGRDRAGLYVVDLTATRYFDSAGIRLLFSLATRLQSRRQELHVVVPEGGITRRVLELADLQRIAPLHATLDEIPPPG